MLLSYWEGLFSGANMLVSGGVAALKTLRAVLNFVKQLWRFAKQATQAMWPGQLTVPFCNKGVISTGKDLRPSLQEFHPYMIPTSKFEIGKDSSIQSLTFYCLKQNRKAGPKNFAKLGHFSVLLQKGLRWFETGRKKCQKSPAVITLLEVRR